MARMTAADAVWYALADLHQNQPDRTGFDKHAIADHAVARGYWDGKRQTLYQHLSQWVNAESPSPSARAAYVVSLGRGGPYRLWRPGDALAPQRRDLPTRPDPGPDAYRQEAMEWFDRVYTRRRPARPARNLAIDEATATAVERFARSRGVPLQEGLALLVRRGLKAEMLDDPMLALVGAFDGDPRSGVDHDEVLYP